MLLDFDLLKLDELRAPGLQVQPATSLVDAAIVRGTLYDRGECHGGDRLVRLGTAPIASVGGHRHHGLHLSAPGHDTAHRHQFSDLLRLYVPNRNGYRIAARLEVALEALHQLGRELVLVAVAVELDAIPGLHEQAVLQVHVQGVLGHELTVPELWQQLGNDIGEDASEASCILHNSVGQARVLLSHIVQVDGDGHLIAVRDWRQLGRVLEDLLAIVVRFVEFSQEGFDGFWELIG